MMLLSYLPQAKIYVNIKWGLFIDIKLWVTDNLIEGEFRT